MPVEGTITLDGKPLAGGRVMLQRRDGPIDARFYKGDIDSTGHYAVANPKSQRPGVPPGEYQLRITSVQVPEGADEMTKLPPERVPPSYVDGSMKLTVPPEGNTSADFAIVTRGRR